MKKVFLILSLVFVVSVASAQERPSPKLAFVPSSDSIQLLSYTVKAMNVIDAKCFGCHSPSGRSDKAKEKLMWEKLQTMEKSDLVAALDEIVEVVVEGEMPPKKMVEKYPGMKMTDEEVETLKSWAESQLNGLVNE